MKIVLLEDDDLDLKKISSLIVNDFDLLICKNLQEVMNLSRLEPVVGGFLDLQIDGNAKAGIESLRILKEKYPKALLNIASYSDSELAMEEALENGAFSFLAKPLSADVIKQYLEHILIHAGAPGKTNWIGTSAKSKEVLHQILQASKNEMPVLIQGETGTGKELAASILFSHYSKDKKTNLLSINCGTLSENLFESLFFGAEKGAYTGSFEHRRGFVEQAKQNGGVIFLDEIASLSLANQAKLLRFIETGEFQRLGDPKTHIVKLKIIAADHQDLSILVREKKFRDDLYHRLNAIKIFLPNLMERKEDIAELSEFFTNILSTGTKQISKKAITKLKNASFSGNIRDLKHRIASAIAQSRSPILLEGDIKETEKFQEESFKESSNQKLVSLHEKTKEIEQIYIQHVLKICDDDKKKAAEILDISVASLYMKIR